MKDSIIFRHDNLTMSICVSLVVEVYNDDDHEIN